MAKAPVTIHRQKDGRHHVVDAEGQTLGKHNSVFSAARQVHEYYGSTPGDIHPPVPTPSVKAPKKDTAPSERPKGIPRP